jgi:hypothetical protein
MENNTFFDSVPLHIEMAAREINTIRAEISRIGKYVKTLRQKKQKLTDVLYVFMSEKGLKKYNNITLASIKPRTKRKTIKEKKKDAMELFEKEGISDPEGFWLDFQRALKASKTEKEDENNEDDYWG